MFENEFKFFLRLSCVALLCCFFAGCGIKGSLHLPQDNKTTATKPAPDQAAPAQTPEDATK
ncbi:MAG: lipoprotein [Burkholderiales bacterium]|jgi:predicted small lipoprotein YifL|nr:lipoprotein [Burkholderiales bacterium]